MYAENASLSLRLMKALPGGIVVPCRRPAGVVELNIFCVKRSAFSSCTPRQPSRRRAHLILSIGSGGCCETQQPVCLARRMPLVLTVPAFVGVEVGTLTERAFDRL